MSKTHFGNGERERLVLTREEAQRFRELAHQKGPRQELMARLLLDAGLRVAELTHLRLKWMLYEGQPTRKIHIHESIAKDQRGRMIPMTEEITAALVEYIRDQGAIADLQNPNAYLFPSRKGAGPLTSRQVERIVEKIGREACGKQVSPHDLRYTFASHMAEVVDIPTVQHLLGHKNSYTTDLYVKRDNEQARYAMEMNTTKRRSNN